MEMITTLLIDRKSQVKTWAKALVMAIVNFVLGLPWLVGIFTLRGDEPARTLTIHRNNGDEEFLVSDVFQALKEVRLFIWIAFAVIQWKALNYWLGVFVALVWGKTLSNSALWWRAFGLLTATIIILAFLAISNMAMARKPEKDEIRTRIMKIVLVVELALWVLLDTTTIGRLVFKLLMGLLIFAWIIKDHVLTDGKTITAMRTGSKKKARIISIPKAIANGILRSMDPSAQPFDSDVEITILDTAK